jgi:DNA-binding response OmpR family regulator
MAKQPLDKIIQGLTVLIADRNPFMRRMSRMMLTNLGAKRIIEASDGLAAVEAIRTCDPDVMFLEWDLPLLDGLEVVRIVRSPGVFPRPNLPIIMLTMRSNRIDVLQALRAGVNEFLVKPTSPKEMRDRLTSVLLKPRPMMKLGEFYVPLPRRLSAPERSKASVAAQASEPAAQSQASDIPL